MQDFTNPSPVVGTEQNVPASTSTENAKSAVSLKEVVKGLTGREYENDEMAAKGIKDTYQAFTQRQPVETKIMVPEDVVAKVAAMEKELKISKFYENHPEYRDYKELIAEYGSDPEVVITLPGFKKAYLAIQSVSEAQSKSHLTSKSRLSMPQNDDYASDLRAMKDGQMDVAAFMAKHKGLAMPYEQ